MRGRASDAVLGVVYLVIILAVLVASYLAYDKAFVSRVDVDVTTDDVGSSLQTGSDVKVRGVLVGSVASVRTDDQGAVLGLQINPAFVSDIPADSKVQLLPKTLFGERYVAIIPGAGGSDIANGDVLAQDTSAKAVELENVFDRLLPVLQAVQPEKLSAMLGELAAALRGEGGNVGDAMVSFASFLEKANPKMPKFADDLEALAQVADTYDAAAPDLLTALDDFTTTSQTLVEQRQTLESVFSTVIASSDTTTGFVSANEDTIIALSAESKKSLAAVARFAPEFPCLFDAFAKFVPRSDAMLGQGTDEPGVHARLQITRSRGAYGPGDVIRFQTGGGPSCPKAVSGPGLVGLSTPERESAPDAGADDGAQTSGRATASAQAEASNVAASDLGPANSPGENELISELVAPTMGLSPDEFPKWGSLMIGPALRGAEVTLR